MCWRSSPYESICYRELRDDLRDDSLGRHTGYRASGLSTDSVVLLKSLFEGICEYFKTVIAL